MDALDMKDVMEAIVENSHLTTSQQWIMLKSIAKSERLNLSHKEEFDTARVILNKVLLQNGIIKIG